jgi:hypothetical protein
MNYELMHFRVNLVREVKLLSPLSSLLRVLNVDYLQKNNYTNGPKIVR